MTDDTTNCDDVSKFLENYYDDLKGQILTIHTNEKGEITDNLGAKKKISNDELSELRKIANTIDDF